VNEHEHEKADLGEEQSKRQEPRPPSYASHMNKEGWRQGGARGGDHSPYRRRDYAGYVRKMEPGAYRPPGSYRHGGNEPKYQYDYDATGGRRATESNAGRYQWDFEEYDRALPAKGRKVRTRGLVVFAVVMLCVLSAGMLSIAGYNIIWALTGGGNTSAITEDGTGIIGAVPPPVQGSGGEVNLHIETRPPSSDYLPAVGELMTIPQVARVVRPSVVGVINYRTDQLLMPATEGSGIIISEDGFIVTNAHVVERSESIVVVFEDNSEHEAVIIGYDIRTDLAVLRVDRTGLPAAVLGDSNQLEVGETVIAIGNPGGLDLAGTVTRGVVSAVNRVVSTPYHSVTYIQTDAAINPGNSGGPLCNEFGQVVGINTAKIVEEGYEGIGFAIPISDAIPIIEDLIRNGRVTGRALLGITGQNVSEAVARDRLIPAGVQITEINSVELSNRGVLRGDIITHIDGRRVLNLNNLVTVLGTKQVGDTVTLTLHRPGRTGSGSAFDVEVPLIEDMR